MVQPAEHKDLHELVREARNGDGDGWNGLISRYGPLVRAVVMRYRLSASDVDDISQIVWLRLFENLSQLREINALPGWISTTTKREALRLVHLRLRRELVDPSLIASLALDVQTSGIDDAILRSERDQAIIDGLAELSPEHRRLLALLHAEPRLSYLEISRRLGMPPGSIGPTRARCLAKLRQAEAVRAYFSAARGQEYLAAV